MSGSVRTIGADAAKALWFVFWLMISATTAFSQGPAPETGNTIFPGGGVVAYGADFFSRKPPASAASAGIPPSLLPTLGVPETVMFGWGFYRDFELEAATSIVSNRLDLPDEVAPIHAGGTGVGDSLVALKYRFLRLDSARGTTQASVVIGPKLPTGTTGLRDASGALLPVTLQPGSGSTDLFAAVYGTYTGLLNVEKLVGDLSVEYLRRTTGAESTRLGNSFHARLYLPYRPYEAHGLGGEWWIGPELDWHHDSPERISGLRQPNSGAEVLSVGAATYYSPRPGLELWFGVDFAAAQQWSGVQDTVRRHFTVGISKQFRIGR